MDSARAAGKRIGIPLEPTGPVPGPLAEPPELPDPPEPLDPPEPVGAFDDPLPESDMDDICAS